MPTAQSTSKWRFPRIEGVFTDEETGKWSNDAFLADLFGPEEVGEVTWHQAPPADHVTDIAAWESWYQYLVSNRDAGKVLRQIALMEAGQRVKSRRA